MMRVHRLDPTVANQIAAGEVVERPASVVKELVENSLDAHADSIVVRLQDGGLSQIHVRDDGQGLHPEDLSLAIERHTTSKLVRIEDLEATPTLGFRGEALAAISSVCRLRLASRPLASPLGYCLEVQFGRKLLPEPLAMAPGTRVDVSDIFGELPARQKALKSANSELGTIQQVVQQLAICRSDVRFSLVNNDRVLFETAGQSARDRAILAIYGREVAQSLMVVNYIGERGLRISGFTAPAHINRANRLGQGLYMNGRWITNWGLRAVIEEAFRPQLPERRHPYFWLWIDVPLNEVDPNAHPTKAEVRITHENHMRAILYRVLRDALVAASPSPGWGETPLPDAPSAAGQSMIEWPNEPQERAGSKGTLLHREFTELVPLAQWHAKYILARGPDGLYLIDQHAAHERIYFERFQRQGEAIRFSQPLLVSTTETLSATEWAAYEQHQDLLRKMGFDVESLGGTTVVIRAVPTAFHDLESHQGLFRTIVESLSGGDDPATALHPVSWAEESHYAMAACKAAIKANRPMSFSEMETLIREMGQTADPRGCPHGRPTMIHLTLEEVDRRFGRRG